MSKILKRWIIASLVASFLIVDVGFISTPARAAVSAINLETSSGSYITPQGVSLGALATRTKSSGLNDTSWPLTKSSTAPYTITGTLTGGSSYQYQTQTYYAANNLFEGRDATGLVNGNGVINANATGYNGSNFSDGFAVQTNQSTSGISAGGQTLSTKTGTYRLSSRISSIEPCCSTATVAPYGSVFGPEVWSVPFQGISTQAVSFEWAAVNVIDDYEIYAFLVKVSDATGSTCTSSSGTSSYGLTSPTTTHTLMAYGRGSFQDWTTASAAVPSTGCYRFRFVAGTYDKTGGLAVGGSLYVANTVIIGASQTLAFAQPSDVIANGSNQTFNAGVTSDASSDTGFALTYVSSTLSKCTVNSSGVITVLSGQTGTCTITVSSGATANYAAAQDVTRSFTILVAATAPSGTGSSSITGTAATCTTLTANLGTWTDGGSAITSTTYQWKRATTSGGTYSSISGATSSTYLTTTDDLNKYIKVTINRINGIGTSADETTAYILVSSEGTCSTPRVIFPSSYVMFAQNGADNNSNPQSEVLDDTKALWKNIMTRAGYTFTGWNTKADGTGTAYADGAQFKFSSPSIILYAQWKLIQSKTTITWATPSPIQEGTALSATQLNAVGSVPGAYTYSPAASAVPAVGKQILKVTFVPTDAKYETVQATVEIEVLAKAKITWANPAPIIEGTALSSTQLNATASVPGSFVYDPKDGALLAPGKSKLKVTFTPTDSRLTAVTAEVSIDVTAKPVVIPAPPMSPTYSVTGAPKTTITWGAGKDAATYTVLVDGKSACSVAALTCDVAQLLGPNNVVTVTSVALSTKTSAAITASYVAPASSQVLTVVNFDTAKAIIKTAEAAKLRAFAALVKAAGYTTLTVYGHTDSVGGVDNQKLSVARANAAITYLKKLLPGVTFEVSGFAASKPVADNATAEGKASNRRTEIFIP